MAHVLVFPYPVQSHINPMIQFSKRLALKGPQTTLVVTRFIAKTVAIDAGPAHIESISDGLDEGGNRSAVSTEDYDRKLNEFGSRTLEELIVSHERSGAPFTCMVYDTFLHWAPAVVKRLGLPVIGFSTQSCAVSAIYYYVNKGMIDVSERQPIESSFKGLPPMERSDFPSFAFKEGPHAQFADVALNQFNVDKDDWILLNSADALDEKVVTCLREHMNARNIGPCVPGIDVDEQADGQQQYGVDMLEVERDVCMKWLNEKSAGSVVYVSFGSVSSLKAEQMEELACGLKASGKYFLWVVRGPEQKTLPREFIEELAPEKGLVVKWCPQVAVLAHEAVGCFLTHCGWNSTLETLSLGVPMVAAPIWSDQPTNAKFVEDVWRVGRRARTDEKGVFTRDEIERCVREVMDGEKSEELRENSRRLRDLTKAALREGGSSEQNLNELVDYLNAMAKERDTLRI